MHDGIMRYSYVIGTCMNKATFIYIIVHIYLGQSDRSSEVQEDSSCSLMVQSKFIATIVELLRINAELH